MTGHRSGSLASGGEDDKHRKLEAASVTHTIAPVWTPESRVLLLGTMPSPASRSAGFFYMHPHNRFWKLLPLIFDEALSLPNNAEDSGAAIQERKEFILRHHLALWDVLASCDIHGAEDSSIKNAVPNDFDQMLSRSQIRHVFCTGKTAFGLWKKLCAPRYEEKYGLECACLPSSSPANARWTLASLAAEYAVIKELTD